MKTVRVTINAEKKLSHIAPEIYGHFSEHLGRCIYNGIFVGKDSKIPNVNGVRKDIIEALKEIRIPVLRWPGGCFADEYHWKDGIGTDRKKMINTNWGGVTEDNSFGTHEFLDLCEELGCEPYVSGNLGSGTVQEMSEWVEYMTFGGISPMADLRRKNGREKPWKVKYFGIGNESWGCGGNMRPEYYADEFRRYQTFCRNYDGNELYKIACGPSGDDYNWTETLMSTVKEWHNMKAISLHYYTLPTGDWQHKGDAVDFDKKEYFNTIKAADFMEELVTKHGEIMDKYDPDKKVGLIVDEWGCWFDVEKGTNPGFLYQQNTVRDAMVAALNLNIFNRHSDRVVMANIAQCVNVLQAVILTEGEKMLLTPTYHIFRMFREHQGAELLDSSFDRITESFEETDIPVISCSASEKNSAVLITAANLSPDSEYEAEFILDGISPKEAVGEILTGDMHDHNTFDVPDKVKPAVLKNITVEGNTVKITMPPCSAVSVTVK